MVAKTATITTATTTEVLEVTTDEHHRDIDPGFASPTPLPPPPPGAPKVTNAATRADTQSPKRAGSNQRRATIGKILATGLTSTTVFALTAAIGWTASAQSDSEPDQVVFDQATGTITLYRNGVAIESRRVAEPAAATTTNTVVPAPTSPATEASPASQAPPTTAVVIPVPIPAAPVTPPPAQGTSSGSH